MWRHPDAPPVKNKTEALKVVATYLRKMKHCTKDVCEFMYGKKGATNAVSKRDRTIEPVDLLQCFNVFRVVEDIENGDASRVEVSAARIVLGSFGTVDGHYTYTATPNDKEMEIVDVPDDGDDDTEVESDSEELEEENSLSFLLIS